MAAPRDFVARLADLKVETHTIDADDSLIPNCTLRGLPLLIYRGVFAVSEQHDPASSIERVFASNGFPPQWRYGMYKQHHYHSTAHEILGVFQGTATIQFGGPNEACNVVEEVGPGDVIVIPAGVAHGCLRSSEAFCMVGAYAEGAHWDMNYGRDETEYGKAIKSIEDVPIPETDPVYRNEGPLLEHWQK